MKNYIENPQEATYFQAAQSYCIIYWADGRKLVKPRPMKNYAANLEANGWCRIHRTYMVNPDYVKNIAPDRESLYMLNGLELPIARRKIQQVVKWRNSLR